MKKLIFAAMLLIVLGGGGAGAYFYFGHPANASVGNTDDHQQAKEVAAHGDGKDHEYVELDPLILPIIDQSGVTQVISMVVTIEVGDKHDADIITKNQPRLKDAYIQELYGALNRHAALANGVVQVSMIKNRLKKISHDVMGNDMISDVLLQVVQQRPM